jgi:hypothetical protein
VIDAQRGFARIGRTDHGDHVTVPIKSLDDFGRSIGLHFVKAAYHEAFQSRT